MIWPLEFYLAGLPVSLPFFNRKEVIYYAIAGWVMTSTPDRLINQLRLMKMVDFCLERERGLKGANPPLVTRSSLAGGELTNGIHGR
jgi:hypothetical protein